MNKREEILNNNLWKLMFSMSLPGILGMVVTAVNSLVDAIFVSHLVSSNAFAGVSLTMPLVTVNAAITGMLSAGGAVLYSKAIGSDNLFIKKHLFGNLLLLVITCWLVLVIVGLSLGHTALLFLGADKLMLPYGESFYKLAIIGSITSILGLTTSALIRAEGNIKYAMKITVTAVILNVIINPVFIKVFHLGVRGSALATVTSMGIYSILNIRYFYLNKGSLDVRNILVFKKDLLLQILNTGLPSFFMQINGFFRQFLLFKLVALYSNNAAHLTVFTAIYRLFSFSAIPVFGMLQALSPIIGINYGAGKKERVKSAMTTFRTAAVLLMTLMALPGILFPQAVLSLLLPVAVQPADTLPYFRLVLMVLLIMPFASTSIVFLQATGNSKYASRLTFSRELLIFLPVILLTTYFLGYSGVYYGLLFENIIYISIVFIVTRSILNKDLKLKPAII